LGDDASGCRSNGGESPHRVGRLLVGQRFLKGGQCEKGGGIPRAEEGQGFVIFKNIISQMGYVHKNMEATKKTHKGKKKACHCRLETLKEGRGKKKVRTLTTSHETKKRGKNESTQKQRQSLEV